METDQTKLDKDEHHHHHHHHHHLSGAYIHSLVKQLSSSRTKDPMNPRDPDHCVAAADGDGGGLMGRNLAKSGQVLGDAPKPQQRHKKQVRRRLHTSRPYQERLLNMAEARKEIVTALKYHRASMKQAREKQQQPQPREQSPPPIQPPPGPCFEPEAKIKSRRNQRVYPSNIASLTDYPWPPPNHFPWQAPQIAPPLVTENLNFNLPNQPLGLNLNFHDFSNLDTNLYHRSYTNPSSSIYSSDYSSPSSSSSPPLPVATQYSPSVEMSQDVLHHHHHHHHPVSSDLTDSSGGMHPAMDDKEMAEIRSIGEKHEMEWKDTVNLVTSAWWSKFLKTEGNEMIGEHNPFDEVMQFPPWLNPNESFGLQQLNYSDDYSQIPALPCLDFGDFEGMDEEWLPYKD